MAYTINKTTGDILITLQDGTADGPDINPGLNASDIDLFGKNYPFYGQYLDENFVKLLQNFANSTAPENPLEGELWYDISTSNNFVLRVYNGTTWLPVTPVWVADGAPVTSQIGAQWWDKTNYQLNMWNGNDWTVVGPAYRAPDGKSGSLVENVTDTLGGTHTVIKFYTNNNVVAIVAFDQPFTLSSASAVTGFTVISPGITLAAQANNLFYGTATNSQQLGNIAAVNYARNDIDSSFYGTVSVGNGNLVISTNDAGTTRFTNTYLNSNISLYTNLGGTSTRTFSVNGSTGEATVYANPTNNLGVAPKQYVDSTVATATSPLATSYSPAFTGVPTAPNASVVSTRIPNTGQVATMKSVWDSIEAGFNDTVLQGSIQIWANAVTPTQALTVDSSTGAITIAVSPTTSLGIANKQYVDNRVTTTAALLAPLDSAELTGTPTTPNVAYTDNSGRIASMASVQGAIASSTSAYWLGSNKTVSTAAPTSGQGTNGDFWFQI